MGQGGSNDNFPRCLSRGCVTSGCGTRAGANPMGHSFSRAAVGGLILLALLAAPAVGHPTSRPFTAQELEPLLMALQAEGFSRASITPLFFDSRLRKLDLVVALNALNPDSEALYAKFLEPFAIRMAKRFRRREFEKLLATEERYGVPMNILVAVLLVETQFGNYRSNFRVVEVFTTLFVESNPQSVDRHYKRLRAKFPHLDREHLRERLWKKAAWALQELVAFLTLDGRTNQNLLEIRGSYAGAFGLPQFLPTSFQQWGADGDDDDRVDLENLPDALASIANFLREHGWVPKAGLEKKLRAVWEYNHSPHYVDAIFGISRKLELPSRKRPVKSCRTPC